MRTKTQFLWALLLLGTALGIGLTLRRRATEVARPELALPGMGKLCFRTTTYGTNHVVGPALGRWVARLPGPVGEFLSELLGPFARVSSTGTTTPSLVVWFVVPEPRALSLVSPPGYSAMLADEHGFTSGQEVSLAFWPPETVAFPGFPRRSKTVEMRVYSRDTNGQTRAVGSLRFPNPLSRAYPVWTPETLPVTRRAGDLEVTLESFSTGHNNNTTAGPGAGGRTVVEHGLKDEGGENYSAGHVQLRSLSHPNQAWAVAGVTLFDATGNQARNANLSTGDRQSFAFSPSPGPDEAAWRLRLEVKKTEGFAADELLVFKAVPLGAMGGTNQLSFSTNYGGVSVTLVSVVFRPPRTNDSWSSSDCSALHVTHSALPEGLHLDLAGAATDDGAKPVSHGWSASNSERTYYYRDIPAQARTADFTFAVHRSQFVEFMVKPAVAQPPPDSRKNGKRGPK